MSNNVSFYDKFVPNLKPGQYNVQLSQALTAKAPSDVPAEPQPSITQTFIVRGPRFQLDPADVHSVFPPAGGTGFYDEYMPMIVLNKRALPWERELDLNPKNSACPWVALLVFSESDLPAPGPPGSLNNPTRTTSVPLTQVIAGQQPGPPENTLGPTLDLKADEDPAKIFCNVIDVPTATFVGLMPVVADMPLLAHVRQVPTVAKEPQDAKHEGWYSSVIANRFAVPPPKASNASQMSNIVHLVSLEGFEKYIQSDGTVVQPTQKTVRLISLYSWSFACLRDPAENFAALMLNLIAQSEGARPDLLLRLPINSQPPTDPTALSAYKRLRNGYTPMSYASQTGDQSFAWYRGPLAPVVPEEFLAPPDSGGQENPRTPTNTSEAMIFDTANGVFDLSYAVAFQTGRSLALSSLPFSTALLQWRRESHASVDLLMERLHSNFVPVVSGKLLMSTGGVAGMGVTDLAALLDDGFVANAFKNYLATDFHQEIAEHVGRTGGFNSGNANGLLKAAKPRRPVTPADLMELTLRPPVTSLLQHLSGLANFGTTADDVGPDATRLKLQSPATEAIRAGAQLVLESPEGETVDVRITAAVSVGDEHVAIESSDSTAAPPAGSVLRLRGADDDTSTLIVKWLARVVLLYGVPFNNLVADERLLPQESIRFFYIDSNWIDALLDGALSVGTQSSRDGLFNQLMRDAIHRAVDTTLCQVRGGLLKQVGASASASELGTLAGFVLRSAVVSGWPGLEVRAYKTNDQTQPMKPVRLDRVGPDVMIGIYPNVPQRVEFDEPSEGLVFGTEDAGIDLRYVPGAAGVKPENIGKLVEPKLTLARKDFPWRKSPGSADTLQIGGTGGLADKLYGKLGPTIKPPAPFGPAAFAVQMVRVPERMLFLPKKGGQ